MCRVQKIDHFQATTHSKSSQTPLPPPKLLETMAWVWHGEQHRKTLGRHETASPGLCSWVFRSPQLFPVSAGQWCPALSSPPVSLSIPIHALPITKMANLFVSLPHPSQNLRYPSTSQLCVFLCFFKVTHQVNSVLLTFSCLYWEVPLPSPEATKVQLQFIQLSNLKSSSLKSLWSSWE